MTGCEPSSVAVCLVVPNGTYQPAPLAAAIRRHHPDWDVCAIWCGDPQLRPHLDSRDVVSWRDDGHPGPVSGPGPLSGWEQVLVRDDVRVAEWRRALAVADEMLLGDVGHVIVLWVGAVAVLDRLDALIDGAGGADDPPLTVVPLVTGPLPDDELSPSPSDLDDAGRFTTDVLVVHRGGRAALRLLAAELATGADVPVGRVLETVVAAVGARELVDERIGVGVWRWGSDAPALLDLPGFDVDEPWVLAPTMEGIGRIAVVGNHAITAALARAAPQLAGERLPLTLPGGVVVDRTVRAVVRAADSTWGGPATRIPVPAPWSDAPTFRRWLSIRFWASLRAWRHDLSETFADPVGADAGAFLKWARRSYVDDLDMSPLISVEGLSEAGPGIDHDINGFDQPLIIDPVRAISRTTPKIRPEQPWDVAPSVQSGGLNLVGYLTREASLGDVARRLGAAVSAAGLSTSWVAYHRSASPELPDAPPVDQRVAFDTTLAVVTADQFPLLHGDHPELFQATQRMIGYWFWELEHIPKAMRDATALVDEIWAGSRFVADAFAAVTHKPVRYVPIPVPAPVRSMRTRAEFSPLADVGNRFVFLVVFDHLSITERKNPIGAIRAFREAFSPGEGPVLLVKSMNAGLRWRQHQAVLAAAGDRTDSDIRFWDEHLDRSDQMALVATADGLVSLHRSEGLGLHLAEAMWLGTPTIATRYSGNVDFMDDSCALLVDAGRVNVGRGGQGVYPPDALWADPDLAQAASAMERLVSDPALASRLALAGQERMQAQPSLAETGRVIADILDACP